MDYSKFLSKPAQSRKPSGISELRKVRETSSQNQKELVWLTSGIPNPEIFPFTSLKVTIQGGKEVSLSKQALSDGLQYGPTDGYPPLLNNLKRLVQKYHSPPCWNDSDVIVTVGNQDGVSKSFEMLLDPGDIVVLSNPCYSDVLCMLTPLEPKILAIDEDEQGMRSDLLELALKEAVNSGSSGVPKVIYLVPYSCNPSGKNLGKKRREEIYAIAQQYDLIIIEDDPYYFLNYAEECLPSFLSLDVDGRVLRFDSFAKIISAGLRIGYVTGPSPLLRRINIHAQTTYICPPMLSQVLIHELLTFWGDEGFEKHTMNTSQFYKNQRDAMLRAVETHLTGLCEWVVPQAGIFIWLKVLHLSDSYPMLMERGLTRNIILTPGREFMVDSSKPFSYMRAAYSCATPHEMMKGMENLAKLIREEIELVST